ncbi:recombinase family protein [Bacillus sp. FSL E2-8895]|uniref:recombinase family protein n=1 Tax=unclassified Bacillus (in: firmicutes) TaxID=185979 RepID=UPI004046C418
MKVGYVRVSTIGQNLGLQIDALKSYGCDKIFQDKLSGVKDKRLGLEEARFWCKKSIILGHTDHTPFIE